MDPGVVIPQVIDPRPDICGSTFPELAVETSAEFGEREAESPVLEVEPGADSIGETPC